MRLLIVPMFLSAMTIALVGCGSDDDDDTRAPTGPRFVPSPLATISDPGSIGLTPTAGTIPGYTISVPADWVHGAPQIGGEDVYNLMDGERLVAQVAVLCEPPLMREGRELTPADYVNNDIVYVEELRGSYDTPQTLSVGGMIPASSLRYVTSLGSVTIRQKVVHFIVGVCHWSVRLRVYAPGDPTTHEVLFDRIVQSFVAG
jgi:hypothetical protein